MADEHPPTTPTDEGAGNLPRSPSDRPGAEPGPARAGTDEAEAAKEGTPRRRADEPERDAASEAAASSGDEVAGTGT